MLEHAAVMASQVGGMTYLSDAEMLKRSAATTPPSGSFQARAWRLQHPSRSTVRRGRGISGYRSRASRCSPAVRVSARRHSPAISQLASPAVN